MEKLSLLLYMNGCDRAECESNFVPINGAKLMVLKINWNAGLELQNGRPVKLKESIRVSVGVGLTNEPPMALSVGFQWKSSRGHF